MLKKVHSAGIVASSAIPGRPFGLRQFDMDFLAVTYGGEAFFLLEEKGASAKVCPVSVVYVPANLRHVYDPEPGTQWRNLWVLFDGQSVAAAFKELLPSVGITAIRQVGLLMDYWESLSLQVLENDEFSQASAFCLLHNILLEIKRQRGYLTGNELSPPVSETINFLRDNMRDPEINFKRLVNRYGISPDSLRKRFKRETGVALHQYFIQLKINAAKSMLSNLSWNIGDLAEFLGFNDQYYFSRLFKKKTGQSPLKYRQCLLSGKRK